MFNALATPQGIVGIVQDGCRQAGCAWRQALFQHLIACCFWQVGRLPPRFQARPQEEVTSLLTKAAKDAQVDIVLWSLNCDATGAVQHGLDMSA